MPPVDSAKRTLGNLIDSIKSIFEKPISYRPIPSEMKKQIITMKSILKTLDDIFSTLFDFI